MSLLLQLGVTDLHERNNEIGEQRPLLATSWWQLALALMKSFAVQRYRIGPPHLFRPNECSVQFNTVHYSIILTI